MTHPLCGRERGKANRSQDHAATKDQQRGGRQPCRTLTNRVQLRAKLRRLPREYARFLTASLAPGAPVILLHHESAWPTTRLGDRHMLQVGSRAPLPCRNRLPPAIAPRCTDQGGATRWYRMPCHRMRSGVMTPTSIRISEAGALGMVIRCTGCGSRARTRYPARRRKLRGSALVTKAVRATHRSPRPSRCQTACQCPACWT